MARLRVTVAAGLISLQAACAMAQVRVIQEDEGQARQRRAAEIAAELVPRVPVLQAMFKARRLVLRLDAEGKSYVASDLASLLAATETSLLDVLPGPDLAPLRDYVAETFRSARDQLWLPHTAAFPASRRAPRILRASFLAEEGVDRNDADAVLNRIGAFFDSLLSRSKSEQLTVTLCVVSRPEGAGFTMYAPSLPGQPYETRTMGEVVNAFRGLYAFRLTNGSSVFRDCKPLPEGGWSCPPVNLWDDPPVLDCDQSGCQHREPEKGDCPRRKR